MKKRYYLIKNKNRKYNIYKKVPYITNKEFKTINDYKILGTTKLNNNKCNYNNNIVLSYKDNDYIIRKKMVGITKGYIDLGNNNYLILKSNMTSIFVLLFIVLTFILFNINYHNNLKSDYKKAKSSTTKIPSIKMDEIKEGEIKQKDNNIIVTKSNNDITSYTTNYIISFNSNGGIGSMHIINCDEGHDVLLDKNKFVRDGYTFMGWSTTKDGDIVYKDNSLIKSVDKNITLYAVWKVNNYNIKYILNGGILKNKIASYNILSKDIKIDNPTKKGYTFNGWKISEKSRLYKDYIIKKGSFGNITLTASFSPNKYKIKFDTDSLSSKFREKEVYYDNKYGNLPEPEKYGYTFLNWTDDDNKVINKNSIYKNTQDTVLTANYKANKYIISFNVNNGKLDNNNSIEVRFDSKYNKLPVPTKAGYKFNGWYYKGEKIDENSTLTKAFDHELTASWDIVNYKITYDLDGGTCDNCITSYNIENETFKLNEPTKVGYNFVGWTDSNGGTPQRNLEIIKGSMKDKYFTANYERRKYKVNYFINGSLWTTREVAYGDKIENLVYETDPYHMFNGWSNFQTIMKDSDVDIYGTVSYAKCKVETGHGTYERVAYFQMLFIRAGFNSWVTPSISNPGYYVATTDQVYEYPTALSMLNYAWQNTSASGEHALNWISLTCDNGEGFSIERPHS